MSLTHYKTYKVNHIYAENILNLKPDNKKARSMKYKNFKKIPKWIKLFFLVLHFMFGQDFGFGNLLKKKIAKILKYYSAVLALTTIVILIWPIKLLGHKIWYWCILTKGVVNFCTLITAKYTVYDFLTDIRAAEKIDVLEKETFGVVMSMYALFVFVIKGVFVAISCILDNNIFCDMLNHIFHALYAICCHSVDLIPEANIVIRFQIYAYVKYVERALKQDKDINKLIERYDKIADCQDEIRHVCDNITFMELFIDVPKLITTSWFMLHYIHSKRKWFITVGELVHTFHPSIQIIIPAVIMELIKLKLDDIRLLLNNWRLLERDPAKKEEITHVMKYLKRRTLQYKIWGIVPTGLSLLVILFNISTTYLIVLIQFTHIYD